MAYVIMISENMQTKYLFNGRMLVYDTALAKRFSSQLLARRYFRKSRFKQYEHAILIYDFHSDKDIKKAK